MVTKYSINTFTGKFDRTDGIETDFQNFLSNKPSYDQLSYERSHKISGLELTYSGAADNYTVAQGRGVLNGHYWSNGDNAITGGLAAYPVLTDAGNSLKDPFIYKEGSTYYMFYDTKVNGSSDDTIDVWYATSTDLITWTAQAKVIDAADCWGGAAGGAWAPAVIKQGSTYYMYVSAKPGGTARSGYFTSSSLTSGYTWVDFVKDDATDPIANIDVNVILHEGVYYMTIGGCVLYTSTDLSANSWTLSTYPIVPSSWDDGIEACTLVVGNPFLLFYGGRGSAVDQRIGLAVSDTIAPSTNDKYKRVGISGMVYLDHAMSSKGPISHPSVYYDPDNKLWYLYVCQGTTAAGQDSQVIVGYYSSDLVAWKSLVTTEQLFASTTNYVYINPAGQLIHAADLPYQEDTTIDSDSTGIDERVGYLRLGSLTVDGSRQVTDATDYIGTLEILDNVAIYGDLLAPASGVSGYWERLDPTQMLTPYNVNDNLTLNGIFYPTKVIQSVTEATANTNASVHDITFNYNSNTSAGSHDARVFDIDFNISGNDTAGGYGGLSNRVFSIDIDDTSDVSGADTIHSTLAEVVTLHFAGTVTGAATIAGMTGRQVSLTGNLGTEGITNKVGCSYSLSGTADTHTAGLFSATGATTNHALKITDGHFVLDADADADGGYAYFGESQDTYIGFTGSQWNFISTGNNQDIYFTFNDGGVTTSIIIDASSSTFHIPYNASSSVGRLRIGSSYITNGANEYQLATTSHFSYTGNVAIGTTPYNIDSLRIYADSAETNAMIHCKIHANTAFFLDFDEDDNSHIMTVDDGGNIDTIGNILVNSDTGKLRLGDDQDFDIYSDGSDGYIDNNTGTLYIDTTESMKLTAAWWFELKSNDFYYRNTSNEVSLGFHLSASSDQNLLTVADVGGNQICLTNYDNRAKDHDHATQTNPTLYVHSDTNPDTANDEWISLAHDVTDAIIDWGSGTLKLSGGNVTPDADDTADLGTSALRWKDIHVSEVKNETDTLIITGTGTAVLIDTDDLTIGDNAGDIAVTIDGGDMLLSFDSNKTIELQETVYKDINMGAAQLSRPSSSQPDIDEFVDEAGADTGVETYAFAPGEKVSGSFEMQHDYKEGTDITFHVHFQGITAPTGTDKVKWQLIYTMAQMDATLDAPTTIDVECDFDTQYEFLICNFTAITGTNFNIGDQLLFQLSRVAATADEYGGDALIATAGIHYEVDTLGSRQIGTK